MRIKKRSLPLVCASTLLLVTALPLAPALGGTIPTPSMPIAAEPPLIPSSFADLATKLTPAVVNISTTQKMTVPENFPEIPQFPEGSPFQDFFNEFMDRHMEGIPTEPMTSLGSGFIIDAEKGYIVTNNHVVRDADEVRVTFADDVTIPAKIIGHDEKTDLAVLQVETKNLRLTAAPFGDSDVMRVGDWVLAIGNPFGLGGTVTTGIISARARDIQSGPYDDYLQTDASINRGNSGGPMFNLKGEVIGINTAIFSPSGGSVGIGFAIPSALAEPVIKQIIQYGHTRRGWLGVRVQTVTEEIAEGLDLDKPHGALVAGVTKGGPAESIGLKTGDVILSFNDQKIEDMKSLPRFAASADIGSEARITYWRNGKEHATTIKIGELEKAEEDGMLSEFSQKSESLGVTIDSVGLILQAMGEDLRRQFGIPRNINGVVVTAVADMSEAALKGLAEGDVLIEINQQPVTTPKDVVKIVEAAQKAGRKSILVLLSHGDDVRFVALRLQKDK